MDYLGDTLITIYDSPFTPHYLLVPDLGLWTLDSLPLIPQQASPR